ncbi:hypothetical protein [Thermomonas sp.]|uniref:hypothetical protein n=1 Tax=Thermomonas sp. TaxID=1971895 RepID=UPI002CF2E7E2|nr:hypothetical protein [Thermomonas sp.]HRO62367.1 hypothetical protein [Thermomonas sp.]
MNPEAPPEGTFQQAERAQLLAWIRLGTAAKIAFFEEMVELAYLSGALAPERLALRDWPVSPDASSQAR